MSKKRSPDPEVQELVERFAAARARRRRVRLATAILGGVLMVSAVVVLLLLVSSGEPPAREAASVAQAPEGSPTSPKREAAVVGSDSSTTSTRLAETSSTTSTTPRAPKSTETATASTAAPSSTTVPAIASSPQAPAKVVVIDPGHQGKGNSDPEPIGPGSSRTKAKVSSGTAGVATGIPESELVLAVSLKLRDALTAAGIEVIMTRTAQSVDLSNIQRAMIANEADADLFVRVHADGTSNPDAHGIHVLYPAVTEGWTDDIAAASKEAAALAQRELIVSTGANDRGIDPRSDMTGFNWADVPVILPEIGFMTNPTEDRRLATPEYQDAIVAGLARSILQFLGEA